jgi:DNA-binding transcriptional MocR family regulator
MTTEHIVSVIRAQILGSTGVSGMRLPPVRVLAHQLHVSKNTVQAAYEELKSQGLVTSQNRQGLFVTPPPDFHKPLDRARVPSLNVRDLGPLEQSARSRRNGINLSSVFIDPDLLPSEKIAACLRSVLKSPGLSFYSDYQGYRPLREKIAERLRRRGIEAHAEHIVTTVGSQQGLDLVCRVIRGPNGAPPVAATENPAYHLGKTLFELNNIELHGLPLHPIHGADVGAWDRVFAEAKPNLVYLTSNYQNPTGYSYSTQELLEIIRLSEKHGFGIVEDDWGSDMLSFSEFRPCLRALGGPNVVYLNSFTKKLLPSMRLGYLLANEERIDALIRAKRVSAIGLPSVVEATLFEFLDRGYLDSHLKQLHAELDKRYTACLELLREHMPKEVLWNTPGGGPVLWLEVPKAVDLNRVQANLAAKNIFISVKAASFFGEPHLHGIMIGYAFLTTPQLARALDLLGRELRA